MKSTVSQEIPLNTPIQRTLFLVLLAGALFLPACGSKSGNTQKPPETVLNPETTPIPEENAVKPEKAYVVKFHKAKQVKGVQAASTTNVSTPTATTQNTPMSTPAMEASAPPKKTGHAAWLWWVLVVLVLAGGGWYFWSKNRSDEHPSQPLPPTGGLSPVSGFTAVQDKIEDGTPEEPSIWTRKLF